MDEVGRKQQRKFDIPLNTETKPNFIVATFIKLFSVFMMFLPWYFFYCWLFLPDSFNWSLIGFVWLFNGTPAFLSYLMPKQSSLKNNRNLIYSWDGLGGSYLSHGYYSGSKDNCLIGVWTLQSSTLAIWPQELFPFFCYSNMCFDNDNNNYLGQTNWPSDSQRKKELAE